MSLYKKILPFLIPLLLLFAGLYFVPVNIFDTDFSKMPGDLGDTRFNNYILEHGHKFLSGKIDKYWDAPFMYPYKNVIALSDNLLGTVPIYSFFRIIGLDRETSFQWWILVLFALNFICCFWALNKWSQNALLSAVGAYVFAFSLYNVGQIGHAQIFPKFMVPLIFYWCWKYLTENKIKYFFLTVFGIVFQFYCGIYLGFLSIYILMFLFIAYFIIYRDYTFFNQFKKIKNTGYHLVILVIAILLLMPLMKPYIDVAHTLGMRKFENTVSSIPRLQSYFFPPYATVFWMFLYEQSAYGFELWWDHYLFIGALPLIGIIITPFVLQSTKIDSQKRRFITFMLLGLFLSFIFCLNIGGYTLWRVIFEIPGFSSMRAINRIINTEVMYFIITFVFVFKELSQSNKIVKWIVFSFPVLVILDNLIDANKTQRFDKMESQRKIEEIRKNISTQYDKKYAVIAYMPINPLEVKAEDWHGKVIQEHLTVMLAAQDLNIPCVNAYTGSYPGNYMAFFDHRDDITLKDWCSFSGGNIGQIQPINEIGKKEKSRTHISLRASNNKYICAEESTIIVNRDKPAGWETFLLIRFENNQATFKAHTGKFFCCELYKNGEINASKERSADWETFEITELDSNYVAFKAVNGKFLSLDKKSEQIFATADFVGKNEKFKLINVK